MVLLWYIFFLLPNAVDHDIHVSVTEIELIKKNKLELTFKIFYDDLQADMGLIPGEELPPQYKGADALIEAFLRENIHFYHNKAPLTFRYKASYAALPAVWIECEVDLPDGDSRAISLYNSIFINRFSDQVNLVKIKNQNNRESYSMNRKKTSIQFVL